jgi:hypothetical protein
MFTSARLLVSLALVASCCLATVVHDEVNAALGPRGVSQFMRRADGSSGDGDCDPCLDSCETNHKRSPIEQHLPMLAHNDTSPFQLGEAVRWRNVSTVDSTGRVLLAFNLEFDCSQITEVCNNMCYGVLCKTGFSWALTIQRDNTAQCQAARKSNACGSSNPNYCSAKFSPPFTSGYSCDEYPFASTKEGQTKGGAATRCVPKGQNSSQGGKISGLYKNGAGTGRLADGTGFTVILKNTGSSVNCGSYGGVGVKNCAKSGTSGVSQR